MHAVPFAGTPAGSFGDAQRQISRSFTAGPYVVMYTAGYADGRPRVSIGEDGYAASEMTSAARGVAEAVAGTLASPPPVPVLPGGARMLRLRVAAALSAGRDLCRRAGRAWA